MRALQIGILVVVALASGRSAAGAEDAPAPFRWEGLARRNPGIVVFRSRWNPGVLELRDDLVRWTDFTNPGKNLVLPVRRLTGHTLVCRGPEPRPCTEWHLGTKTETYVFRQATPAGEGALRRAFDALRAAYADVPAREER